jgi:hypothetical protein
VQAITHSSRMRLWSRCSGLRARHRMRLPCRQLVAKGNLDTVAIRGLCSPFEPQDSNLRLRQRILEILGSNAASCLSPVRNRLPREDPGRARCLPGPWTTGVSTVSPPTCLCRSRFCSRHRPPPSWA